MYLFFYCICYVSVNKHVLILIGINIEGNHLQIASLVHQFLSYVLVSKCGSSAFIFHCCLVFHCMNEYITIDLPILLDI